MNWRKFIIFAVSILSISIVVFNNLMQLSDRLFGKEINYFVWLSFASVTMGTIFYVVVNRNMFK